MRQAFIESDLHRNPACVALRKLLETALQRRVPRTEDYELCRQLDEVVRNAGQQIESFLVRQPAHHAEQWRLRRILQAHA